MPDDQPIAEAIESTFKQLDLDRTRLDNHLVPEPTSLLAQDDAGSWQKLLLSQHVWSALASTYDHLDLFRSTVHARKIYPTATYSLLRGGLLGACQAMWLLEPEEAAERQERGRRYSDLTCTPRANLTDAPGHRSLSSRFGRPLRGTNERLKLAAERHQCRPMMTASKSWRTSTWG